MAGSSPSVLVSKSVVISVMWDVGVEYYPKVLETVVVTLIHSPNLVIVFVMSHARNLVLVFFSLSRRSLKSFKSKSRVLPFVPTYRLRFCLLNSSCDGKSKNFTVSEL